MILANKHDVTQELLKEYLNYDITTGWLTWKKKLSVKTVIGNRAGTQVRNRDNRIIKIFGHVYIEHRLIWLYVYGYMPKQHEHIDHIDHNEANNAVSNLRLVSQKENNRNLSHRSNNTTGVMGVWVSKVNGNKKFMAEIKTDVGRLRKSFYSLDEAIAQRKQWEQMYNFHPNHGNAKIV